MKSFRESVVLQFQRSCRAGQMTRSSLCCQSLLVVAVLFIKLSHIGSVVWIRIYTFRQVHAARFHDREQWALRNAYAAVQMWLQPRKCRVFSPSNFSLSFRVFRFHFTWYRPRCLRQRSTFFSSSFPFSLFVYVLCKIKNNNKCGWTAIYLDTQCTHHVSRHRWTLAVNICLDSVCALFCPYLFRSSIFCSSIFLLFFSLFPSIFHCWIRVQVKRAAATRRE